MMKLYPAVDGWKQNHEVEMGVDYSQQTRALREWKVAAFWMSR